MGRAATHVWLYTARGVGQHCLHDSSPWLFSVVLAAGLDPACGVPEVLPAGEKALRSALPSPVLRWFSGSSPQHYQLWGERGFSGITPRAMGRSSEGLTPVWSCHQPTGAAPNAASATHSHGVSLAPANKPHFASNLVTASQTPDFPFSKMVPEQRLSFAPTFSLAAD